MLVVSMVSSTSLTFKFSLIVSRANFIKYLFKMLLPLFSADIIMGNWFCISASDGMQKKLFVIYRVFRVSKFFLSVKSSFFIHELLTFLSFFNKYFAFHAVDWLSEIVLAGFFSHSFFCLYSLLYQSSSLILSFNSPSIVL